MSGTNCPILPGTTSQLQSFHFSLLSKWSIILIAELQNCRCMRLQFVRSCQPDRREKNSGWLFGRRLRQSPSISSRLQLPCQIWKTLEIFGDNWRHHQMLRGGKQVDTTHKWRYDDQGIRFDCLVIVGVRQFEHFLLLTSFDNAPSNQAHACVIETCHGHSSLLVLSLIVIHTLALRRWGRVPLLNHNIGMTSKVNFKT